jgi:hypothetical protein
VELLLLRVWVVVKKTYLITECDDPKAKRYIGSHVVQFIETPTLYTYRLLDGWEESKS